MNRRYLGQEVVSQYEAIFAGFLDYMPNPDLLLSTTGETLETYDKMLLDPHIGSMLDLRKSFTRGRAWDLEPAGNDTLSIKATELVKDVLKRTNLANGISQLLMALEYGYSVVELVWRQEGDLWVPTLKGRAPKRFVFSPKGELMLAAPYPRALKTKYKFIVHRNQPRGENPYGTALLSRCYWPWTFKRAGLRFWLTMCEKFGVPTILALFKCDNEEEAEKRAREITDALYTIQSSAAAALANIEDIETLEAKGAGEDFLKLCTFCNFEISKAITNQILSSDIGDSGSYALSKEHKDTLNRLALEDGLALAELFNTTLIPWIVELNLGVDAPKPTFQFDFFEVPPWDIVKDAIDRGVPVSRRALYTRYNLPKPEDETDAFVSPKKASEVAFSDPFGRGRIRLK